MLTFCPPCLQGLRKHNTDNCTSTYVAGADENTERGQGRMRACWDNAALRATVCLRLWWIIMECCPVKLYAVIEERLLKRLHSLSILFLLISCKFWSITWPLYQNWASARAGLPGADWSGGTGRWCWGISPGLCGSESSALARRLNESGRSGSIEANPRHSAMMLQPSDGPSRTLLIV